MAKRIYCLDPKEREKECTDHAYRYLGRIPCTGPQVCTYCGARKEGQDKLSGCDCYVRDLDDETRFSLRYGAHDPACPLYMPSLDRNDAREDAEFRQAATEQEVRP